MWRISRDTEAALWAAAKRLLPDRASRQKSLVPAIERRSNLYTTNRDELDAVESRDAADLAARALFFTPADAAKIKVPIAELRGRNGLPTRRPLRVLDVGAGCGAMTLGLAEALEGIELDVLAIDKDRDALELLSATVAELGRPGLTVETRPSDLGRVDPGPWDLIVLGNVLNELAEPRAAKHFAKLMGLLSDDGVLIVIEPALRETARRLHALRDSVIRNELGTVFAPCTRQASRCPALDSERDWCHEDRPFEPSQRLAALTNATGMRAHRIKFSYLVVTRRVITLSETPGLLRIVSGLKKSKGQSELWTCGEDGWEKRRLQKRDRTPANRGFERAKRGQLLEAGIEAEKDVFTIHDPAKS